MGIQQPIYRRATTVAGIRPSSVPSNEVRNRAKEKKTNAQRGIWPVTYKWVAVGTLVAYTALGSHRVTLAQAQTQRRRETILRTRRILRLMTTQRIAPRIVLRSPRVCSKTCCLLLKPPAACT